MTLRPAWIGTDQERRLDHVMSQRPDDQVGNRMRRAGVQTLPINSGDPTLATTATNHEGMDRRRFLTTASMLAVHPLLTRKDVVADVDPRSNDHALGLLLGGLIGDALGGPLEFSERPTADRKLVDARSWSDDRQLNEGDLHHLAERLPLHGYQSLRPDAAPYGPWRTEAAAGTLTDDSRHKIVLMRAIAAAKRGGQQVTADHIAQALLNFQAVTTDDDRQSISELNEEGFREYRYAARWLLGERDLAVARPVARLWAGVSNCSGQMMFPPLAVAYPGDPIGAYQQTFQLDFIDTPMARDFAAAVVAGLAAAIAPVHDATNEQGASAVRWERLFAALRQTDPYEFAKVPFVGRPLNRWLDMADEWVARAGGRPKRLYQLLESEGKPVYWWDAHFTLLVPVCMLKLCNFNSLAAMHLTLDFGHDTDSYAQLLGCLAGAVHGSKLFAEPMRNAVTATLRSDYDEDVQRWLQVLTSQA